MFCPGVRTQSQIQDFPKGGGDLCAKVGADCNYWVVRTYHLDLVLALFDADNSHARHRLAVDARDEHRPFMSVRVRSPEKSPIKYNITISYLMDRARPCPPLTAVKRLFSSNAASPNGIVALPRLRKQRGLS